MELEIAPKIIQPILRFHEPYRDDIYNAYSAVKLPQSIRLYVELWKKTREAYKSPFHPLSKA